MNKCKHCNVYITDDVTRCPLCNSALETVDGDDTKIKYPDVHPKRKKLSLFLRIFLASAIVVETVLVTINYYSGHETWWSFLAGLCFAYAYFLMRFAIAQSSSGRWRIVIGTLLTAILIITMDAGTGYDAWSTNYVFPVSLGILTTLSIALIFTKRNQWQSFMVVQLTLIAIAALSLILIPLGIITKPIVLIIVLMYTILSFISTLIIGGSKAQTELRHRFHINR
ncbi:MAG: hypothetical protein JJE03_07825 [Peptostreptococcaceae bacterium]|nr:hypothetical protein [Peptostreptococcaceae bacterium]